MEPSAHELYSQEVENSRSLNEWLGLGIGIFQGSGFQSFEKWNIFIRKGFILRWYKSVSQRHRIGNDLLWWMSNGC